MQANATSDSLAQWMLAVPDHVLTEPTGYARQPTVSSALRTASTAQEAGLVGEYPLASIVLARALVRLSQELQLLKEKQA